MEHDSVSVERGGEDVVGFYLTVPFACMYHPNHSENGCTLSVYIMDTSTDNRCSRNTIKHHNKCARTIQGITKRAYGDNSWTAVRHEFDVVTSDSDLGSYSLANSQFTFGLRTLQPHHQFWNDSLSDTVKVSKFPICVKELATCHVSLLSLLNVHEVLFYVL